MEVKNIADRVHYFNIKAIANNRETVEFLSWSNLRWELRLKYDWYFKYRAALLQVKYPKFDIQIFWGNEPAQGKMLAMIQQGKIKAKRAKITEIKNKLEKAKKNWCSLFPIEDDPTYQRAIEKLQGVETELNELNQIAELA
ncbi:MAG TPA: hypothetical protein VKX31_00800 [Brumimicrobium sp.]|nr:hypothetical protein [Brumimicrobium sp.]